MMKLTELTDEDLKELEGLLNVAILGCLDDSLVAPFEEQRKGAIKQANIYKKLFNKISEKFTYTMFEKEEE